MISSFWGTMIFISYNNPVGSPSYKCGSKYMVCKRLHNLQRWILLSVRINEWENNLVILPVCSHLPSAKKAVRLCISLSQGLLLGCLRAVALPVFVDLSCISSIWRYDACVWKGKGGGECLWKELVWKGKFQKTEDETGAKEKYVQFIAMIQ